MQILKYTTEEEKEAIITEKTEQGLTLVAVSNVGEGSFLGFDDRNATPPTNQPTNQEINNNQIIIMDVLATMYEDMLMKGTV
jgi:hypothetical protein